MFASIKAHVVNSYLRSDPKAFSSTGNWHIIISTPHVKINISSKPINAPAVLFKNVCISSKRISDSHSVLHTQFKRDWYFYYSSNGRALFFKQNGRSPASHRRRTIRLEHLIAKLLYRYPNHVVSSGYFYYLSSEASVPHAKIFNTPAFAILKEGQHGLF